MQNVPDLGPAEKIFSLQEKSGWGKLILGCNRGGPYSIERLGDHYKLVTHIRSGCLSDHSGLVSTQGITIKDNPLCQEPL